MNKAEFESRLKQTFFSNGLSVYATEKNIDRFFRLSDRMLAVNAAMNLTALRDEESLIARHFADSLLAAELLPEGACTLLDVGSGSGMPALPLAIVRPDICVTALDATAKKTAYIAQTAELLGLQNVHTLTGRAEELSHNSLYRERFDVVCARAVAELRILLEWSIPFLKPGGIFLALKGKNAQTEIESSSNAFSLLSCKIVLDKNICLREETTTSERHLLMIKKLSPTEKKYPRRNALITKRPL